MKPLNYLTITLSLLVTACAPTSSIKPSPTPSGKSGFFVECDNAWPDCFALAAKQCPSGHTVVDKSETSTATQYGPLTRRSMLIECK